MAATSLDPVCGMTVDPAKARSTTYDGRTFSFCNPKCLAKFTASPAAYLAPRPKAPAAAAPVPAGTMYVCPMDPEVRSSHPGACPKCGMALEPEDVQMEVPGAETDDPELRSMRRRFVVSAIFTVPLMLLSMTSMVSMAVMDALPNGREAWVELGLAQEDRGKHLSGLTAGFAWLPFRT